MIVQVRAKRTSFLLIDLVNMRPLHLKSKDTC